MVSPMAEQTGGETVMRRPTRARGVRIPLGLLFVMTAVLFRLSRYTRRSLLDFGKSSDVLIDVEAYKLMMLVPLAFLVLAALQWPRRTTIRVDPPLKLLVALFVFAGASLLWAHNPTYGVPWLLRLAIPVSIYFLIVNYTTTDEHLRWWGYLFVFMGFVDALITAVELPFLFRLWGGLRAADPEIRGYINIYAHWAIVTFAFSLHFLAFGATRRETTFGLLGALASLVAVYFTFRRAPVLAVVLFSLVYMAMIGRRRRQFVAFVLIAAVLAGGVLIADPRYAQRVATIGQASDLGHLQTDVQRVVQFFIGAKILRDHWLLGIGIGNLMQYIKDIYGIKWLPHNIYLEFGDELGIGGLAIFLAFVGTALSRGWRSYRAHLARGDLRRASLSAAAAAALLALLLAGFFQPIRFDFFIYVVAAMNSLAWEFTRPEPVDDAADEPAAALPATSA